MSDGLDRLDKSAPKTALQSGMVVSQGMSIVDFDYTSIYINLNPKREKGVRTGIAQMRVDVEAVETRRMKGNDVLQEHWTYGI